MPFKYQITVQPLAVPAAEAGSDSLTFPVTNHDDLMEIVERVQALGILPPGEVAEFSIGLKLFSEVLLRHRRDSLFADIWPQMSEFMRRLKSTLPVDLTKEQSDAAGKKGPDVQTGPAAPHAGEPADARWRPASSTPE